MQPAPAPVGLIGLGTIGSALARRLASAGNPILGWDPDSARTYLLGAVAGAAHSPRQVFERCSRIVLALADNQSTLEMIYRHADLFRPGLLLIDTTGGEPAPIARLAREIQSRGTRFVEATVLGTPEQTQNGQALVLLGGNSADVTEARELFSGCVRQIIPVGTHGAGARVKLIISLVVGLNRVALAEGLSLARHFGLNPGLVLELLRGSAAYSRVMDSKGEKMVRGDFTAHSRLMSHLREIRLILAEAARTGAPMPLATQHLQLLEQVASMGHGDEDNSAVIRAYGWTSGLESSTIWRTLPESGPESS